MTSRIKLFSVLLISSVSVSAFGGFWTPIPFVGPPIIVSGNPVHIINSGMTLSVLIPGNLQYNEFGQVVNRLQRLTHFEVIVGPESTARGCYPASKADGFRAYTSVTSPTPRLKPTAKIDTYDRTMVGDSRSWRVHRFEINGGVETAVSQINIFFPAAPTRIVQCAFQVNVTNAETDTAAAAETTVQSAAALAPASAAGAGEKLPRLTSIPAVSSETP